jgi:integrase
VLRAAAAQWQPKAARDVALLRLIAELRVRESEVCRLRVRDYDGTTIGIVPKGHREVVVVKVPPGLQTALDTYLKLRGPLAGHAPLLASCDPALRGDGFLTRGGLYQLVRELAARAGVPGPVSPHRLLHTAATALADAGTSNDDLQHWGRWEKRDTAEAYTDHRVRIVERLGGQLDSLIEGLLAKGDH